MYTIKINNNSYKVEKNNNQPNDWLLNDSAQSLDIFAIQTGQWSILKDNKSYTVELIKLNKLEKTLSLKVNGTKYNLTITDKFDTLLKSLGMDNLSKSKVNNIKAPMPGLVLSILVEEGREVKKGEALLVLEAMKMENILKSPADGIIKKIAIQKGMAVEKNQILIHF
jgi:biotin carboxyl carrier protein